MLSISLALEVGEFPPLIVLDKDKGSKVSGEAFSSDSLKNKQEKYPDTLYVKDLQSILVKKWDLKDDISNIVLFNKDGRILFLKKGKLNSEETFELIALIQDNI